MDVRLSPEQIAMRDSAVQVVNRLGPGTVAQLGDTERAAKLDAAVESAGWRQLRTPTEDGPPWASAVEVAVVAEELGRGLADVAFFGPTLAADLRRRAGAPTAGGIETIALVRDLAELATIDAGAESLGAIAVDARGSTAALVLLPDDGGRRLGTVALGEDITGADLTRRSASVGIARASAVEGQSRPLDAEALIRWHTLGLSVACADLVGVMRGALSLATDYARERKQYGATIGSFQAVQHMLADAHVSMEGSRSIALHAAWAVDALTAAQALAAGAAAKAYCARAARAVCETCIQVHGGIGNTWECLAHVFLRRAMFSTEVLGGIGANLELVLVARGAGGFDGLL